MLTKVTFYLSDEDRRNLDTLQEHYPNLSVAMIFKEGLALLAKTPQPDPRPRPAQEGPAVQAIRDLLGLPV